MSSGSVGAATRVTNVRGGAYELCDGKPDTMKHFGRLQTGLGQTPALSRGGAETHILDVAERGAVAAPFTEGCTRPTDGNINQFEHHIMDVAERGEVAAPFTQGILADTRDARRCLGVSVTSSARARP